MAIDFNGFIGIENISHNGKFLTSVTYNDMTVWEKFPSSIIQITATSTTLNFTISNLSRTSMEISSAKYIGSISGSPSDAARKVNIARRQDGTQYLYFFLSAGPSYSGVPEGKSVYRVNEEVSGSFYNGTIVRFKLMREDTSISYDDFLMFQWGNYSYEFIHDDSNHEYDFLWTSGKSLTALQGTISGTAEVIIK